ncbi:hypothetical protein PNOK_0788000 [Pyrrhoderma noxium]|uniref:Uncharacterized protein n=1 Tax=Pyrrhoderma noxium TaxID=2282107 RepID=A0A286U9K7_9AGAM|nr:hypothetical protein PNOK_0788000 [Pyrrhoderma noxium]
MSTANHSYNLRSSNKPQTNPRWFDAEAARIASEKTFGLVPVFSFAPVRPLPTVVVPVDESDSDSEETLPSRQEPRGTTAGPSNRAKRSTRRTPPDRVVIEPGRSSKRPRRA